MAMQTSSPSDEEFAIRGRLAWMEYQRSHDMAGFAGWVAAVEPYSGRVWFGHDALDAIDAMNDDGVNAPVWLVRVGFDYLDVKGRR